MVSMGLVKESVVRGAEWMKGRVRGWVKSILFLESKDSKEVTITGRDFSLFIVNCLPCHV